ncbi:class I SAM-dependent methyltransferase [Intrasporangium sp.]|uniref:class I SAM-dependent methyltransferase n=1 Tax=Intrasporangium sp. TaxID=1925024 RepID=UPI003221DD94
MDVAMVERLAGPEGWSLLQALPEYDEASALQLQTRLREHGVDPALLAAAMGQSRLRARAREKFGEFARGMLLTSDGLEQSTRLPLAARHAGRFAAAGIALVHDLGCGLGADAMALAALGLDVSAVDADPVTAAMAAVNLRHWPGSTVRCARAEQVRLPAGAEARTVGAWVDPARRTVGVADARGRTRRVRSLDDISPSWDEVRGIADRVAATGAKLSPAFPHAAVPPGAEAQWTSWHGEVLECAVWWGPLAETAGRTAAVCGPGSAVVVTEAAAAGALGREPLGSLDTMGDWLYEADRAVIRAGLTGALVAAVDGTELGADMGYVTSSAAYDVGWARRYRVRAALPFSTSTLGRWLRDHGHDRVTIKKRGIATDPDLLRRRLKMTGRGKGGSEATLVLTRVGGRQVAVVVEPA